MACAFCELIDSGDARWVAREPSVVAFLPLPGTELAPGHTLVVPRRHTASLLDADESVVAATAALVHRVCRAMTTALDATGVVVLNASGPGSGQTVPHLHFHVVPRWDDEEETLPWLRQRSTRELAAPAEGLLAAALTVGPARPPEQAVRRIGGTRAERPTARLFGRISHRLSGTSSRQGEQAGD